MKTIEFRQSNMYCNNCFMNAVNALTGICGVKEMEIDMRSKIIRLSVENGAMGRKKIRARVNAAIRSGSAKREDRA